MPGPSASASAASAPPCTRWPACACVENALGIHVPPNADIIRNIMYLTQMVQDHVIHFYHLHALDWVDVVSALKADPAATAALAQKVSPQWPTGDAGLLQRYRGHAQEVRRIGPVGHLPERLLGPSGLQTAAGSQSDGGGPLPGSAEVAEGDRQDPHHLRRQESASATTWWAAWPRPSPCRATTPSTWSGSSMVRDLIKGAIQIVEGPVHSGPAGGGFVLSGMDQDRRRPGQLHGLRRHAAERASDDPSKFRFPRGVILNKNLAEVLPLDLADPSQIQEEMAHSWYNYPEGKTSLHPWEGVTEPKYTGPKPPYKQLDENGAVLVAQGAALERARHGSGTAGAHAGRLRQRPHRVQRSGDRGAGPPEGGVRRRSSRRWDVPRRADLEARLAVHWLLDEYDHLIANLKSGDSATADTTNWDPGDLAGGMRRASASPKRRAARWATGSRFKTGRSPNTRSWCLPPGTHRPRMARDSTAPMRRR